MLRECCRHAADIAGAERQHQIAILDHGFERFRNFLHALEEYRLNLAACADRASQRTTVSAFNRRFACGLDLAEQQCISLREDFAEILEQIARTRVAMRLEHNHHAARRMCSAHRLEGCCHFPRSSARGAGPAGPK